MIASLAKLPPNAFARLLTPALLAAVPLTERQLAGPWRRRRRHGQRLGLTDRSGAHTDTENGRLSVAEAGPVHFCSGPHTAHATRPRHPPRKAAKASDFVGAS
eukprot:scaffold8850_cov134-Isochrysis_galbana.AAC.13